MSNENDPDGLDRPVEAIFQGNKTLGVISMCLGLFGVFFFGSVFDLFGNKIAFDSIGPYLFYLSIWLGCFGALAAYFHWRIAFIATVCIAAVFLGIFTAGKLSRGEL